MKAALMFILIVVICLIGILAWKRGRGLQPYHGILPSGQELERRKTPGVQEQNCI